MNPASILEMLIGLFAGRGTGGAARRAGSAVLQQLFRSGRRPRGVPVGSGARPVAGKPEPPEARSTKSPPPEETGFDMIRVTSSNVHSIGYQSSTGTLAVRYLAPILISAGRGVRIGGKTNAPGPLYHYFDVSPKLWKSFESASSKGKWVWDHLRIRGTVAGHKYDYRLVTGTVAPTGVQLRYIPRRASGKGFMSRSRYLDGKRVKSTFKSQRFGTPQKGKQFYRGR